jgi:hypothetical protein
MAWVGPSDVARPVLVLACAVGLAAAQPAAPAFGESTLDGAANALRTRSAHVDPALAGLVREERLDYAARVASRAADGRRIVVAFVGVRDAQLDAFRERLYARLRLAQVQGALVVATPTSITMHTPNLTPDAELAIIRLDARALMVPAPRPYTKTLAELVYDTGLVIHNTTPGAVPRGLGLERNLATFSGHFAGETQGSSWLLRLALPLAGVVVIAGLLIGAVALVVRRRTPWNAV